MGTSILVTTFDRNHLLELTLPRLKNQLIGNDEVIILDDGIENQAKGLSDKFGFKYIWTGKTKNKLDWRIPGFAFNIGAKQAKNDLILLTCAEIYHVNGVLELLMQPFNDGNQNILSIPNGKYDNNNYLQLLQKGRTSIALDGLYNLLPNLSIELPFCLVLSRQIFLEIGGYDEDMIGQAFDDNDIVDRLIDYGCKYVKTNAKIVHLWHTGKQIGRTVGQDARWLGNRSIYLSRKGIIKRNSNKEWGKI